MLNRLIHSAGFRRTPRLLARALGIRAVPLPLNPLSIDYKRDFLFGGFPEALANAPSGYERLLRFAHANKLLQRQMLQEDGLTTPVTRDTPNWVSEGSRASGDNGGTAPVRYVVRPLRHFGGLGYRLSEQANDYNPFNEYISEVFPKLHEYRVIFVYGTPVATMLKRMPQETPNPALPWNHSMGAYFISVNNPENNRLRYTDVYENLSSSPIVKASHLVAADVLLAKRNRYSICELNFCPALTGTNFEKVVAYVRDHVANQPA